MRFKNVFIKLQKIQALNEVTALVVFENELNEAYKQGITDSAKIAMDNECDADGYHICLHNDIIAKEIRKLV